MVPPLPHRNLLLLTLTPIRVCTLPPISCWTLWVPGAGQPSCEEQPVCSSPCLCGLPGIFPYKEATIHLEGIEGYAAESRATKPLPSVMVPGHAPPKGCLDPQSSLGELNVPLGLLKQITLFCHSANTLYGDHLVSLTRPSVS